MRKHSATDRAFMKAFADKLSKARKRAKDEEGVSYEEFAQKLGVTRAGLHKYLNEENVPSLEILQRAKALGVEVQYGDLSNAIIKPRSKKRLSSDAAQMLLPLVLENLSDQNLTVQLSPKKSSDSIHLNVTIRLAASR